MRLPSSPDSDEAKPYFARAKETNETAHARPGDEGEFVVSKPIIMFEGTAFEPTAVEPTWRLRQQTLRPVGPAEVALESIAPDSRRIRGLSSGALSRPRLPDPVPELPDPSPLASMPQGESSDPEKLAAQMAQALAGLTSAYAPLTDSPHQRHILHALHRLQLYAQQAGYRRIEKRLDEVPARRPEAFESASSTAIAPELVASLTCYCLDVQKALALEANICRDTVYHARVLAGVKQWTRVLRESSLSLAEITDKIATKPSTTKGKSAEDLQARLSQLVRRGLEELSAQASEDEVLQFVCALVHASASFYVSDGKSWPESWPALVNEAIRRLSSLELAAKHPLIFLAEYLCARLVQAGESGLAGLVELVLRDDDFSQNIVAITDPNGISRINRVLDALIAHKNPAVWKASCSLIARRPPAHFRASVERLMTRAKGVPANVWRYLFLLLNAALETEKRHAVQGRPVDGNAPATERYRTLLALLASYNEVHVLNLPSLDKDDRERAYALAKDVYNLDAKGPIGPQGFFSTAAFLAAKKFSFYNSDVRRAAQAALQQAGRHPVVDLSMFDQQLDRLQRGFECGLSSWRVLILRALGERLAPGMLPAHGEERTRRCPIEAWLQDIVLPDYEAILELALGCFPLTWCAEDFQNSRALASCLVKSQNGEYFVAESEGTKTLLTSLRDWASGAIGHTRNPPDQGVEYFSADYWDDVVQYAEPLAHRPEAAASILEFSGRYEEFKVLNLSVDKTARMKGLLSMIVDRFQIRADGSHETDNAVDPASSVVRRFRQRLDAMSTFFGSVASFSGTFLDKEAQERFFHQGCLTESGRAFIADDPRVNENDPALHRQAVVDRLFEIGHDAVHKLICTSPCDDSIARAMGSIDLLVRREHDLASFSTESVVASFNTRQRHLSAGEATFQLDEDETKKLRNRLFDESRAALEARGVNYIMPNQAVAAQLCRQPNLMDKNILMKMGTGQGKSIVIAATALEEVGRLSQGAGQYVFVLTGYNHLAERDHALAKAFLGPRGVESTCIASLDDIRRITADTKVIYADAKTLCRVVESALRKLLVYHANPRSSRPLVQAELDFLRHIYGERHRFILDEYDLLIHDLDFMRGEVHSFYTGTIDKDFIAQHKKYSPDLNGLTEPTTEVREKSMDGHDGELKSLVRGNYFVSGSGEKYFLLRVGALRLSMLLRKASRIVGLSGSTKDDASHGVRGLEDLCAEYFEIPASRNPHTFGTLIAQGDKDSLRGERGIWRTCIKEDCSSQQDQIASIVADVRAVRTRQSMLGAENQTVRRPVLVFVDPLQPNLLRNLCQALGELDAVDCVQEITSERELKSKGLDKIGLPGQVTVASVVCGRGADIVISPNVPDSLHVVVATNLPTDRLLTQLIGRTGRMGSSGSYSVITCGPCVSPPSPYDGRGVENLLHEMSAEIVQLMAQGRCNEVKAKQWLMLVHEICRQASAEPSEDLEELRKSLLS